MKKNIQKSIYLNHLRTACGKVKFYLKNNGYNVYGNGIKHKELIKRFFLLQGIELECGLSLNDQLIKLYLSQECEDCCQTEMTFRNSSEWRSLRKKVLRTYKNMCMKCYNSNRQLHIDHIKPVSKYPELQDQFENLQILCCKCNIVKSNKNEIDYRRPEFLLNQSNDKLGSCADFP